MKELLNPRLWMATAVFVGLLFTHVTAFKFGRNDVLAEFSEYRSRADKALAEAQSDARKKEAALQNAADTLRSEKDEAIVQLERDLAGARRTIRLLRAPRPPEPPGAVAPPAGPAASCSGAGLYAEDADFLIGEAARAQGAVIALRNCEALYDRARTLLSAPATP